MIEIGYNFLKNDLDKIQKFKNPTLDIVKSKLNKNLKYKIFLNKTQFNNSLDKGFIKYKLTDSKKRKHVQLGDGIGSLLSMALPFVKSNIPINLYKIYKNYNIITNIYRIQDINSNLCGMFCVLFCLYKVDSKNKFISFLNLFNPNNFLKNELI